MAYRTVRAALLQVAIVTLPFQYRVARKSKPPYRIINEYRINGQLRERHLTLSDTYDHFVSRITSS